MVKSYIFFLGYMSIDNEVDAYDRMIRYKRLTRLSDVVLLSGGSGMTPEVESLLEDAIKTRVAKEFPNPNVEEQQIITGLQERDFKFVPRVVKTHNDGEIFVQVRGNVREKDVHFFYDFGSPADGEITLHRFGDALKRSGVGRVTLYVPYLVNQRQDKKDDGRVSIAIAAFMKDLETNFGHRLERIVTSDLHARQIQGLFDGPLDELSAIEDFAAYYRAKFENELTKEEPQVVIVSPDAGGAKRAEKLARLLSVQYVVLDKRRTGHGEAEHRYFLPMDVNGMRAIMIDDIIDSAGSVAGEFENLQKQQGPVQYLQSKGAEVYVCATHAVFSEKNGIAAEERLRKSGAKVLVTDSIQKGAGYYHRHEDWLTVLSFAYPLAKAFYCNVVGNSISEFIAGRQKRLTADKLNFALKRTGSGVYMVDGD
jgi:ribose-phosphate pyrophosphokinase